VPTGALEAGLEAAKQAATTRLRELVLDGGFLAALEELVAHTEVVGRAMTQANVHAWAQRMLVDEWAPMQREIGQKEVVSVEEVLARWRSVRAAFLDAACGGARDDTRTVSTVTRALGGAGQGELTWVGRPLHAGAGADAAGGGSDDAMATAAAHFCAETVLQDVAEVARHAQAGVRVALEAEQASVAQLEGRLLGVTQEMEAASKRAAAGHEVRPSWVPSRQCACVSVAWRCHPHALLT
jgi:hypothetical protein